MKSFIFRTLISTIAVSGIGALANACDGPNATTNSGANPTPLTASSRVNSPTRLLRPSVRTLPGPAAPTARLTVLPPDSENSDATDAAAAGPQGRISVIPSDNVAISQKPTRRVEPVSVKIAETPVKKVDKPEDATIAKGLKGLVGTWRGVSRNSDGELATIELKLDNKGWAKLTVPASDGTTSTTTRRVELDNNELKLTSNDNVLALGKLVEFNDRQMVLDRGGNHVTFVRL